MALAARYGIDPKPRSTVLGAEEQAMIVCFSQTHPLPLEDCLYSLQATA